jgi:hypothetical protein
MRATKRIGQERVEQRDAQMDAWAGCSRPIRAKTGKKWRFGVPSGV